jgi:hypothetical protein
MSSFTVNTWFIPSVDNGIGVFNFTVPHNIEARSPSEEWRVALSDFYCPASWHTNNEELQVWTNIITDTYFNCGCVSPITISSTLTDLDKGDTNPAIKIDIAKENMRPMFMSYHRHTGNSVDKIVPPVWTWHKISIPTPTLSSFKILITHRRNNKVGNQADFYVPNSFGNNRGQIALVFQRFSTK